MASYQFTRHDPDNYQADELFTTDRRVNGLTVHPHGGNYVREVTDEPLSNWEMVTEQAGAQILSSAFPHSNLAVQANAALVRSAMRGDGRGRWR